MAVASGKRHLKQLPATPTDDDGVDRLGFRSCPAGDDRPAGLLPMA
jgi:hypothetical protein